MTSTERIRYKILLHRQFADLGVQRADLVVRVPGSGTTLVEDLLGAFEKLLLPRADLNRRLSIAGGALRTDGLVLRLSDPP